MQPKLIIHGGAGLALEDPSRVETVQASLAQIVLSVQAALLQGLNATEAIVLAIRQLEDDPLFNAGTGSVLQADGQIRMSAGLMDGSTGSFSGVINVTGVQNPILLAHALQTSPDRVLSETGAAQLARELGLPLYDPATTKRVREWVEQKESGIAKKAGSVSMGTVGAVALDQQGRVSAGTSTGGRGYERNGRVSDSAQPAGNYANAYCGVSCTGIGEDIIDEGVAVRVVVRVTDGLDLTQALNRTIQEAQTRNRDYGMIALDAQGNIGWQKNTPLLLAAYTGLEGVGFTF